MLLDFFETKQQEDFLSFLIKSKENGNQVFLEECITKELNAAFYTTHFQNKWNVLLDRFMINAAIKLFFISI